MQTSNITKTTPLSCDAIRLENTSLGINFSSAAVPWRASSKWHLTSTTASTDAADSALRQINEADMTFVAVFENSSGGGLIICRK